MPYKFSRRSTMPYIRHSRRGATMVHHKKKAVYRKRRTFAPKRTLYKAQKKSMYQDKSRNRSYLDPTPDILSKRNLSVFRGLTNAGVLEKRVIAHRRINYQDSELGFTGNVALGGMSFNGIQLGSPTAASDTTAGTGITNVTNVGGFTINPSFVGNAQSDRYVHYKNLQSEVMISTKNITFDLSGVSSLTAGQIAGASLPISFRVLLCQKRQNSRSAFSSGIATSPVVNWNNSLLQGYDQTPYGPNSNINAQAPNQCRSSDLLWGNPNLQHYRILEDKKFTLSCPQSQVGLALNPTNRQDSKYPVMKKLVFNHPISKKVLVSTIGQPDIAPQDMNDQYFILVMAGQPSNSAQTASPLNPVTSGLWSMSYRGFTSYIDA